MEEYREFVNKLLKRGSNAYLITDCKGSRDAWKWVRKNKWKATGKPIDQNLYSKVITAVNKDLAGQLLEGHIIEFPHHMGNLRIEKNSVKPYYKDGKLITPYPVDWAKTARLWYEDKEAKENHLTVKRVNTDYHYVKYNTKEAVFANKNFYSFRPNRSLKIKIDNASQQGAIR